MGRDEELEKILGSRRAVGIFRRELESKIRQDEEEGERWFDRVLVVLLLLVFLALAWMA